MVADSALGTMKDQGLTSPGEIDPRPSKDRLMSVLSGGGICVAEGVHSIRLVDFEHFVFQSWTHAPAIEADSTAVEKLIVDAAAVSIVLGRAGLATALRFTPRTTPWRTTRITYGQCPRTNRIWSLQEPAGS